MLSLLFMGVDAVERPVTGGGVGCCGVRAAASQCGAFVLYSVRQGVDAVEWLVSALYAVEWPLAGGGCGVAFAVCARVDALELPLRCAPGWMLWSGP